MNIEQLMADGEYLCAGLFEEPERSLFYRKSLGIRRFLENSLFFSLNKSVVLLVKLVIGVVCTLVGIENGNFLPQIIVPFICINVDKSAV